METTPPLPPAPSENEGSREADAKAAAEKHPEIVAAEKRRLDRQAAAQKHREEQEAAQGADTEAQAKAAAAVAEAKLKARQKTIKLCDVLAKQAASLRALVRDKSAAVDRFDAAVRDFEGAIEGARDTARADAARANAALERAQDRFSSEAPEIEKALTESFGAGTKRVSDASSKARAEEQASEARRADARKAAADRKAALEKLK